MMDEDCLYLNVWAPADPEAKNLPVFVWYFGGGLQVSHPSEMEFDGEPLPRWDAYTPKPPTCRVFGDASRQEIVPPTEVMRFLMRQYCRAKGL